MVDILIYVVCVDLDAGICYHHLFTVRYQYAPSTPQCVQWSSIWCAYQFDVRFNKHLKTIWLPQWNKKSRELNSVSNLKLLYNKIHIIYWSVSSTAKVSYQRVIGILIALGIIWLIKYSNMEWFRHHLLSAPYWDQLRDEAMKCHRSTYPLKSRQVRDIHASVNIWASEQM